MRARRRITFRTPPAIRRFRPPETIDMNDHAFHAHRPRRTAAIANTLIAIALGTALAGCTTTPTAPPAVDLPAATIDHLDLDHWWTEFNEPALNALVDEALANNLDLRLAIARIDEARAGVTAA